MATLGHPQFLGTLPVGGNWAIPWRTVNSQIASSTIQDTEYNINHAGIKDTKNLECRMKETEDIGNRIEEILRSLVAPPKRGRRMTGSAICGGRCISIASRREFIGNGRGVQGEGC